MAWIANILFLILVMNRVSKSLGEEKENINSRVVPKEEESKNRIRRLALSTKQNIKKHHFLPHLKPYFGYGGYGGAVIDGGWSNYGQCSKTCKIDAVQSRTCTNPMPKNGGKFCSGSSYRSCNQNIDCGCPDGYEKKDSEKRKRRFAVMPNILNNDRINNTKSIIWPWSSVSKRLGEEKENRNVRVVTKEEEIKKRIRRSPLRTLKRISKVRFYPHLKPYFGYWGSEPKMNNKNIANICCFIIKSKTKGILVLTDHAKQNIDFDDKCPSQNCAYSPYLTGSASLGEEICLNNIGSDYSCCSRENGVFCANYLPYYQTNQNPKNNIASLAGKCSYACTQIANCGTDPHNAWCQEHKMEDVVKEGEPATKPNPPPDDCIAVLEDEPVEQSAEYVPNALLHMNSYRGKRQVWSACPQWNHWRFTCYKAVYYMLYNRQKHWFFVQKKQKWKYFEHECCPEFQSKCSDKKVFKENRAAALCPAYN